MNAVRAPAVVVLVAMAVGAAVFGTGPTSTPDTGVLPPLHAGVSLTADSGDLWFCVGPTVALDGVDERVVTLTSISDEATDGWVTVIGNLGSEVERAFRLEPGARLEIRPGPFVPRATFAGVTVEVPGGRVLVDQRLAGQGSGMGVEVGPCGTITSDVWQVPWATTAQPGNRAMLLLYNPFRAPAIADLRFIGDLGRRETLDRQGVVVAGRSISVFDLSERIPDSSVVSATVDVRVGQVVAARLQIADGSGPDGSSGLALTPGAPEVSPRLFLPGVPSAAGLGSSVVVLNPGDETTELEVLVRPAATEVFVEPYRITLRGRQREVVDLGPDRLDGIGPYSVEVRSLDGVPLAASLVTRQVADGQEGGPVGLSVLPAVGVGATGWRIRLQGRADATLVIANPGATTIATVSLSTTGAEWPAGVPDRFEIDPAGQIQVPVGADGLVLVSASVPVVVVVRRSGPEGRTTALGVAVAGSQARPAP